MGMQLITTLKLLSQHRKSSWHEKLEDACMNGTKAYYMFCIIIHHNYAYCASALSLHRESTDSMIYGSCHETH